MASEEPPSDASTSLSSSTVSFSESEDDATFSFNFVRDVEGDIDDVVRLGALGRFAEARALLEQSLNAIDNIAPIAVEIMRLMYDQGDLAQLYTYASAFLADDDCRKDHESWTAKSLCILYLMHDICIARLGSHQDFVTTSSDLSKANLDVMAFPEMDDEQILTTVLMVMIAYTQHEVVGPPAVTRRTLPATLRQDGALYDFLTFLLDKRNFWAAAYVMTACFQHRDVDCARIWRSSGEFIQKGSAGDDEPTTCYRITLLLTFMEGLLFLCNDKPTTYKLMNKGLLPPWNKLLAEQKRLVALLQTVSEANAWTNSRNYLRYQILDLGKKILDRTTRYSAHEGSGDRTELARLEMDAWHNRDHRLLHCIQWRKEVLVERKDPEDISSLKSVFAMPFAMYRAYVDEMTHQASDSRQPPWQFSQMLGGNFVYTSSTDSITLQNGRQFARPPEIPKASLVNATWEGPLPDLHYIGSPQRISNSYQLLDGQPTQLPARFTSGVQQPAPQVPYQRSQVDQNQGVPRTFTSRHPPAGVNQINLSPQPAQGPVQTRIFQQNGKQVMQVVDRQTQVQVLVEKSPPDRPEHITPPDILAEGIVVQENLRGTANGDTEKLDPSFFVRPARFFVLGRVFKVLWAEPAGGGATAITQNTVENKFGERVHSKVRWFVVIRRGSNYCCALPITTYGGRGVSKYGVIKSEHGIIYTGKDIPQPSRDELPTQRGEQGMRSAPIRVDPDTKLDRLDPKSRINFAAVHTVHHNIKAKSVGVVNQSSIPVLQHHFQNVWNSPRAGAVGNQPRQNQQRATTSTTVSGGAEGSLNVGGLHVVDAKVRASAATKEVRHGWQATGVNKHRGPDVEDDDDEEEDYDEEDDDDDDDDDEDDEADDEEL